MYFIDKTKKPQELSLSLSKPNTKRTTIAKLKHVYGEKLTVNFGKINELTFTVPYEIESMGKIVRNPVIDIIKEKYLIKAKLGDSVEWFLINKINKSSNDYEEMTIQCFSLGYQLWYGRMIDYVATSYNCLQVTTDCLKDTGWTVGYINPEFNLKYRQFDVSSQRKLDFLYSIADTFEGTVTFDTVNKKVNIYKEDEISKYKGFWITYGKYLQNVEEEIDSDEIVTRLFIKGADNLNINTVNPTGQSFIDDFSYFIYPFEQDEDGNVISHSNFMEDDLCIALTAYNKYTSSRKDEFGVLLSKRKEQQENLTTENNTLSDLNSDLQIILDNIEIAKQDGQPTEDLNKQKDDKNTQIETQKGKIAVIQDKIKSIDDQINTLKNDLKMENHLSPSQLEELTNYIHIDEWTDENKIDANDLYEAGLKRISEINSPPVNITAGIVNFFSMITEQHNWNRFGIGDIVTIEHDKLNIQIKTKLTQIVFDFDNMSINVTISNSKKVESTLDKINRAFYTISKVNTDYNNRKVNWNAITNNFNLRNDRLSETPSLPIINRNAITHVKNDNGSVNLTVKWDYPDFNTTQKNEDNIDGFLLYLYASNSNEVYQFGSKMADETKIDLMFSEKKYTFPSLPSNMYYTIGVRAYRRVDEDINVDGILLSEIVNFNQNVTTTSNTSTQSVEPKSLVTIVSNTDIVSTPYQPETSINVNGKINGVKYTTNEVEPENPEVNDVWVNPKDAKTRVWNGNEWTVSDIKITASDITTGTLKSIDIDGVTITGSKFLTKDNMDSGQIKIEGSNFISTKYNTNGNEYVKITNGSLEIRTLSATAGSYQTVKINANTGMNISSDINPNASMRFDVYETLSTLTDTKFGIKATSTKTTDIISLYLEADDNVYVNSTNIYLNGIVNLGSAFQYNNGFINAPTGSVSIAQNTVTADTYFFGKYGVLKYDSGSLYAPNGTSKIQENTITANTFNFGQYSVLKYDSGSLFAPNGSTSIQENTIKANTITQLSNADYKKNISDWNYNATEMICDTPIRQFQYNNELDEEFPHVGVIVQEAPVWAIELEGYGVDIGAMASISWKSIQELHARIQLLEQQLGITS